MKQTDQNIIQSLKFLKNLTPDASFRNQMEQKVQKLSATGRLAMPFFALRVAVIVFAILLSSTGMVKVASTSKPGEALYPVKQLVDTVKTSFTADKYISNAPAAPTKQLQELTPTPTQTQLTPTLSPDMEKQTLPAEDFNQHVVQPTQTPTSTQTPSPTPTPTPKPIGGVQVVPNSVNPVVQTVPVNVQIDSSSQSTPTPTPKIEGSKDNGSNAGAGGSLLPKINFGM